MAKVLHFAKEKSGSRNSNVEMDVGMSTVSLESWDTKYNRLVAISDACIVCGKSIKLYGFQTSAIRRERKLCVGLYEDSMLCHKISLVT